MKKVLPVLIVLFFLIPVVNVFADDGNPDNYKEMVTGESINIPLPEKLKIGDILKIDYSDGDGLATYSPRVNGVRVNDRLTARHILQVTMIEQMVGFSDTNIIMTLGLSPIKLYNVWLNDVLIFDGTSKIFDDIPEEPEPIPAGDVMELSAKADYDRVDLAWRLPKNDNLKHVNIYREKLNKTMFDRLLGVKSVSAAGDKIFETNGTYFNDLTVAADTKYEYTLTTESTEGLESDGVSVTAITPKKPGPEMGGEETEVDEAGNYTFKWTSPTTGKVRILVGGKEYAVVNAADLEIKIPAADMKFTFTGAPDVKLIPIDEDGNEGAPTAPPPPDGGSGVVKLPFGPTDVLSGTFGFIGILSGLILLVIVIYFTPRIIQLIKKAMEKERSKKRATGRRM